MKNHCRNKGTEKLPLKEKKLETQLRQGDQKGDSGREGKEKIWLDRLGEECQINVYNVDCIRKNNPVAMSSNDGGTFFISYRSSLCYCYH